MFGRWSARRSRLFFSFRVSWWRKKKNEEKFLALVFGIAWKFEGWWWWDFLWSMVVCRRIFCRIRETRFSWFACQRRSGTSSISSKIYKKLLLNKLNETSRVASFNAAEHFDSKSSFFVSIRTWKIPILTKKFPEKLKSYTSSSKVLKHW